MLVETPEEIRSDIEANPDKYITERGDVRISALNKLSIAAVNIFYEHITSASNLGCNDEQFRKELVDYYGQNQDAFAILNSCALLDIVGRQMAKEGKVDSSIKIVE